MPEPNYAIPQWLQPPDPAAAANAYTGAFRAGAAIAQERQQLALQAQKASLDLAMRQQEFEQQSLLEEHKLALEQARMQSMVGLRDAQLQQADQRIRLTAQKQMMDQMRAEESMRLDREKFGLETGRFGLEQERVRQGGERTGLLADKAARSYAARQEAQKRITAGEDPRKVYLELGPSISGGMTGMGSLINAGAPGAPFEPGKLKQVEGAGAENLYYAQTGPRSVQYFKQPGPGGMGEPSARPVPGAEEDLYYVQYGDKTAVRSRRAYNESEEVTLLRKSLAQYKSMEPSENTKKRIAQLEQALKEAYARDRALEEERKRRAGIGLPASVTATNRITPPAGLTNAPAAYTNAPMGYTNAPAKTNRWRYNPTTGKREPVY